MLDSDSISCVFNNLTLKRGNHCHILLYHTSRKLLKNLGLVTRGAVEHLFDSDSSFVLFGVNQTEDFSPFVRLPDHVNDFAVKHGLPRHIEHRYAS